MTLYLRHTELKIWIEYSHVRADWLAAEISTEAAQTKIPPHTWCLSISFDGGALLLPRTKVKYSGGKYGQCLVLTTPSYSKLLLLTKLLSTYNILKIDLVLPSTSPSVKLMKNPMSEEMNFSRASMRLLISVNSSKTLKYGGERQVSSYFRLVLCFVF